MWPAPSRAVTRTCAPCVHWPPKPLSRPTFIQCRQILKIRGNERHGLLTVPQLIRNVLSSLPVYALPQLVSLNQKAKEEKLAVPARDPHAQQRALGLAVGDSRDLTQFRVFVHPHAKPLGITEKQHGAGVPKVFAVLEDPPMGAHRLFREFVVGDLRYLQDQCRRTNLMGKSRKKDIYQVSRAVLGCFDVVFTVSCAPSAHYVPFVVSECTPCSR